jgi:hypothetical protein
MLLLNVRDLTDLQWAVLDAFIPEPPGRKDGRGFKPSADRAELLREAIIWRECSTFGSARWCYSGAIPMIFSHHSALLGTESAAGKCFVS